MDVAVADPGRLDAQQHFLSLRFGIWILPRFQRLSPFDDLHRAHDKMILRFAEPFVPARDCTRER
jgi:hypothetical protein